MSELVLASASVSRARMLTAAGVPFRVSAADLDETSLIADLWDKGSDAAGIAAALAEQKAVTVSRRSPGALVLGGDSVLAFGPEIISKCLDMAALKSSVTEIVRQDASIDFGGLAGPGWHAAVALYRYGASDHARSQRRVSG